MTSYPDMVDSDLDGLNDEEDPSKLTANKYDRYDRYAAVEYALKWCYERNPEFREYPADCANFVSQCLFNGCLSMNDRWHCIYNGPKSFKDFVFSSDEVKWIINHNPKYLENWIVSDTWNSAENQYYFFSEPTYCVAKYTIKNNSDVDRLIKEKQVEIGDIIYVADDSFGHRILLEDPHHATIISTIDDKDIYYAAHTADNQFRSVKACLDDYKDVNVRLYVIKLRDVIIYE